MQLPQSASLLFAPPLCAACRRRGCAPEEVLCDRCGQQLGGLEPVRGRLGLRGLDSAWAAAPHEGVARELVVALKHRRLLPVAATMAARIAALAPVPVLGGGVLVPVPTAPGRSLLRGFDPATELAAAIADLTGAESRPALLRRRGGGRQVGRRRGDRLGRAPRIEALAEAPRSAVLVDDVLTTGATVAAAAAALRDAGALRVVAVTFTRRL